MGGGAPNTVAQMAVASDPVLAQWAVLMADSNMRMVFEASCGLPIAAVVWALGEFTPLKRAPKVAKRFIPLLSALIGMPLATFLSAYIPGLQVVEMAGLIVATGGGGSIGVHALDGGRTRKWVDDKMARHPTNPPGSPGDDDSTKGE